jgi:hypothetical protein
MDIKNIFDKEKKKICQKENFLNYAGGPIFFYSPCGGRKNRFFSIQIHSP